MPHVRLIRLPAACLVLVLLLLPWSSIGAAPPKALSPAASTPAAGDACSRGSTIEPPWPSLLCETFDNNDDDRWVMGDSSAEAGTVTRALVNGAYQWQVQAKKPMFTSVRSPSSTLTDFFAAVNARLIKGSKMAEYGVTFRNADSDNLYTFNVREQGQYRVDAKVNGEWSIVLDWTDTTAIRPGRVNRLAVKGEGNTFTLYVNNQRLSAFTDDRLADGKVGVNVDIEEAGSGAIYQFDSLEIRVPSGSATIATPAPTATATLAVGDACGGSSLVPVEWASLVCETFGPGAENRWSVGDQTTDNVVTHRTIANGKYRWQQKAVRTFFSRIRYMDATLTDFFVAADARLVSGLKTAQFGLSFRELDERNVYALDVDDQGRYRVDAMVDGKWSALIDWTPSAALSPGRVNRLAVKGEGDRFTVYINGEQVTDFTDDRLAEGRVGMNSDIEEPGKEALFEFDNFEVRAPENGAVASTPTAAASATPTPRAARKTPTPVPQPTSQDSLSIDCDADWDLKPAGWRVAVCDPFDDNIHDWSIGVDDSDYGKMTRSIAKGVYSWRLDAQQAGYLSARYGVDTDRFADAMVAVSARRSAGPEDSGYGLQFRTADGDNFYTFQIADDGQYKVRVLVNNEWKVLTDWTPIDAIHSGQWNRLAVKAEGTHFTFYVNGIQVDELEDDNIAEGQAAINISAYNEVRLNVDFDNFAVWTP
jgi:hypothetical protein